LSFRPGFFFSFRRPVGPESKDFSLFYKWFPENPFAGKSPGTSIAQGKRQYCDK